MTSTLTAAWPPEDALDAAAMTAARWAYSHDEPAGADTGTLPIIPWYFVPLRIGAQDARRGRRRQGRRMRRRSIRRRAPCSIRLSSRPPRRWSAPRSPARWCSAKTATETERVRNTLLASISHDFRTPLSSILGSATSLIDYGDKLDRGGEERPARPDQDRRPKASTRWCAICWPSRASMPARWNCGATGSTCARSSNAWSAPRGGAARSRRIEIDLPADLPLVRADATLGRAGDRQCRRAMRLSIRRRETRIVVDADVYAPDAVALRVTDDGPGIAPSMLPQIFEKFVKGAARTSQRGRRRRAPASASPSQRASWKRMAGRSRPRARSPSGRGARFTLTFPARGAPA